MVDELRELTSVLAPALATASPGVAGLTGAAVGFVVGVGAGVAAVLLWAGKEARR